VQSAEAAEGGERNAWSSARDFEVRPLVVTSNYPTPQQPNRGTFVETLVRQWHRAGRHVAVIAPHPYWSATTRRLVLSHRQPASQDAPRVLRPAYATFSALNVGPISTRRWTQWSFERATRRSLRGLPFRPSLVYSHFLYPSGESGFLCARRLGLPAVVALGESKFGHWDGHFGYDRTRRLLHSLDAILAVSRGTKRHCMDRYGVPGERIVVVPNAPDTQTFAPTDRRRARQRLGLPLKRTIVAFTGHFIERKGPLRLLEALRARPEVGAVFLGEGPQHPEGEQVLFAGKVPHRDVPTWLSAADLFVLPTRAEGSPNAILEAMACGLPAISYRIPALEETLDDSCGLLVDADDGPQLSGAIASLVDDPQRRAAMSAAARKRAESFTLEERAARIFRWLGSVQARHRAKHRTAP